MELGKQIRKYRNEQSLSQDGLAEKVYVSRQTISNWENSKSYPDVNSLVLLSEVFGVSLDQLIKRISTNIFPSRKTPHGKKYGVPSSVIRKTRR